MGANLLFTGWDAPEDWGTWGIGQKQSIAISLASENPTDFELEIDFYIIATPKAKQRNITLLASGNQIGQWKIDPTHPDGVRSVIIPQSAFPKKNGLLIIDLLSNKTISPAEAGTNAGDFRQLSIGIRRICIRPQLTKA